MGMPRITNGGPERARKRTLGEREGRSCKHRIQPGRPSIVDLLVIRMIGTLLRNSGRRSSS